MTEPVSSELEVYRALAIDSLDAAELARADVVLANGEFLAERCVELGANPASVVTLHEGIDRSVFNPDGERADLAGAPRIVTPSGAGLGLALQACAQAAQQVAELRVVVLGDDAEELPRFASVASGDDNSLARHMRWADALLLTDAADARFAPRALACGTPCIAPDTPAFNDGATHMWDSLLVEATPKSLAKAVSDIADGGLRARLAAPARTSSEAFDADAVERRRKGILEFLTRQELPKVSVVLPTYNRATLIEKAVRNILEQDYANLELIIVNDGSSDGTREILDAIDDPRVRVIHQENRGLPRALNSGFEQAAGEYWTWTSDDNRYRPGAIKAMVRELELEPEAGLVYANTVITGEGIEPRTFVGGPPERLTETNCVGACFLYRASVARLTGEYDPEYTLVEDHDYWLRLRRHAPLIWLRRFLYEYDDSPGTLSHSRFLDVQRRRLKLLEREHQGSRDWSDRKVALLCRDASYSKQNGMPFAAMRSAMRALREQPSNSAGWRALIRAVTPSPLLRWTRNLRGLDAT